MPPVTAFASRPAALTLETSNVALAARYDEIPYAATPHAPTHPDRLATVATFLGRTPPPVARCSVLEVGCNDGANLIPMAVSLPGARFVGCDLSPRALDSGRRIIAELGLSNIDLVQEDVAALSVAHGSFDYIVAHGVYSWVPPRVRDALFAVAAERLAPHGVVFVSFNVLPGCRVRQAAWDILHHHTDAIEAPRARLAAARSIARIVGDGGKALHDADDAVRAELRAIATRSDSALFHDDLGTPNDAVFFHEFAAHAARFGLAYLAEAELSTMSGAGISAEARALLSSFDPATREQYLDFVRLRRFRQSLLCRREATADMTMHPQRVAAMQVSADPSLLRAAAAGKVAELARGLDPAQGGGGPVRGLLDELVARSPGAIPVAALREGIDGDRLPRPLEAILTDAYVSAIVNLHVHPPSLATRAGERPCASPLARLQARAGQEQVTSLLQTRVRLADPNALRLLALLDGSRQRAELAAAIDGPAFGPDRAQAGRFVAHALEQFARLALMTA
jgi:2-polyprenyl-3-methyl-5-hydroxy-6-metoxy-1,4-benzoquinol methylase